MRIIVWIVVVIVSLLALIGVGASMLVDPILTTSQVTMSLAGGVLAYLLASLKGRSAIGWTIAALIMPVPVVILIVALIVLGRF